ncbi:hypothetical protein BDN67DRAFT_817144 [Paxillus ammoniavirescens]|nr:hypothetical protein BDN67DRAFT_817144 [Paxillus ammoniavirescens]
MAFPFIQRYSCLIVLTRRLAFCPSDPDRMTARRWEKDNKRSFHKRSCMRTCTQLHGSHRMKRTEVVLWAPEVWLVQRILMPAVVTWAVFCQFRGSHFLDRVLGVLLFQDRYFPRVLDSVYISRPKPLSP